MSKVITFINEKGGIGKTSSCFNVAWCMAEKKKVLLVDLDGQRANLTFFAGIEKTENMMTMYNILHEGKNIRDAIITINNNLSIVPATTNTANISQSAKMTKLRKELDSVKGEYDYIFIDVNPTPNWSHVLSLCASDYVIIPMLPDVASLEANLGIVESINEVREAINPALNVLGILINKNNNRTNLSKSVKEIADRMAEGLETTVFETKIRDAVPMSENVAEHIGVTEYSPKSPVAQDIRALCEEIERRIK